MPLNLRFFYRILVLSPPTRSPIVGLFCILYILIILKRYCDIYNNGEIEDEVEPNKLIDCIGLCFGPRLLLLNIR